MDYRIVTMLNNFNFHIQTLRSRCALRASFSVQVVRFTTVRSFYAKIIVPSHFKKISILTTILISLLLSFSSASASILGIDLSTGGANGSLPQPDKLGLPFENA